jgi:hypothetical protein
MLLLITVGNLFPQDSRIPKPGPDGAKNWLANNYATGNSDRDLMNVIFFEVPDTITSTLYFSVYDAGCLADLESADHGTAADPLTYYSLYGGLGALSDPKSQKINYTGIENDAKVGTLLSSFTATKAATYDGTWYYFPNGVSPGQGEHIGNKYYFKIVVQLPPSPDYTQYNAYILDISYNQSVTPGSIPGVRSFAYSWSVYLYNNVTDANWDWEMYPFVPENARANSAIDTDYIVYHNYDFDTNNPTIMAALTNTGKEFPTKPAHSGNIVVASTAYSIYDAENTLPPGASYERSGTWTLRITEANPDENLCDFFFTRDTDLDSLGDGELLRIYSHAIPAPALPTLDHVVLTYQDGTALADNTDTETIYLQIVDSNGDPVNYSREIYVQLSDPVAVITSVSNGPVNADEALVTTDSYGTGWLKIKRPHNSDGDWLDDYPVQVQARWNGTGGVVGNSDTFGTSGTVDITVTFYENPDPTISSASNQSYNLGVGPFPLPQITITHPSNPAKIYDSGSGELRIRLPASLYCTFNPVAPAVSGTAAGNVNTLSFSGDNKTLIIDITGSVAQGGTIILTGLNIRDLTTFSTGRLALSWDGGANYTASDDKVLSIDDPGLVFWTGNNSINWGTAANWSSGSVPAIANRVLIPAGATRAPTLDVAGQAQELTIESGATLTTGANTLTVSNNLVVNGTLNATGGGDITVSGTLAIPGTLNAAGGSSDIAVTGNTTIAGTLSAPAATGSLSLTGNLTVTGSLNAAGGCNITVGGDATFTGGTFTAGAGTFTFNGGDAQAFTPNGQTFGLVALATASTAVTMTGTATLGGLNTALNTGWYLNGATAACTLNIVNGGSISNNGTFRISNSTLTVKVEAVSGTFNFTGTTSFDYNGQDLSLGGVDYQVNTVLPANTTLTLLSNLKWCRLDLRYRRLHPYPGGRSYGYQRHSEPGERRPD